MLKKTLFIGLGGTGIEALLHTKKMFFESYGEVPSMIGFLGVDTYRGEFSKCLKSSRGDVFLESSEQCSLSVYHNIETIYRHNKERFDWLSEGDLRILTSTIYAQTRSIGRFAITCREHELVDKLKTKINNILGVNANFNFDDDGTTSSELTINVVFSICGSTGAGSFINVAYLLREIAPNANINAYVVLPGIFYAMISQLAGNAKIAAIAYGALLDLDYLMHLKTDDIPVNIDYLTRTYSTNDRPFDAVYLIDNKNAYNDEYNDKHDLTQMISLALITSTEELFKELQSLRDGLLIAIRCGSMDIENKMAWVSGFGICEICYKGEQLSEILKHRIIQLIIELLQSQWGNAYIVASNWIDNSHIRGNNGRHDVIDKVCSKWPKKTFHTINTPKQPKPEIDAYIRNIAVLKPEDIDITIQALKMDTKTALRKLIVENINEKGGVANCKIIISEIDKQISLCIDEMRKELADFEYKRHIIERQVSTTCQKLTDYMGRFLKPKKQNYIDAVTDSVNILAVNLREIDRRKGAIQFYTWLKEELANQLSDINKLDKALNAIKNQCEQKVAEIQYNITNNTNIFQIDLAKNEVNKVTYDDRDIDMNDFINQISLPNHLFDLIGLNTDTVRSFIENYAAKISDNSKFSGSSVDAILRTLSDKELDDVLKEAAVKSEPLIKYHTRGYVSNYSREKYFYVGVEEKETSVLNENNRFANMFTDRVPQFASIGIKDKIIIYCQYDNMPLFTVEPVPTYEHRYNEVMRNSNCHFGVDLKARMDRENFSIYPRDNSTDAVELWVKGLIFGLIKNQGDKYVFMCVAEGDIIDDYWMDLPQDRYEAFVEFSNYRVVIELEYKYFFDKYIQENGREKFNEIWADAIDNYLHKYAHLGFDKTKLKSKENKRTFELIQQELRYVRLLWQ